MEITRWTEPEYDMAMYRLTVYELSLGDVKPYVFDDEVYYKLTDLQSKTRITTGTRSVPYEFLDKLRDGYTPEDLVKEVLYHLAGELGRKMLEDLLKTLPEIAGELAEKSLEKSLENRQKIARERPENG